MIDKNSSEITFPLYFLKIWWFKSSQVFVEHHVCVQGNFIKEQQNELPMATEDMDKILFYCVIFLIFCH